MSSRTSCSIVGDPVSKKTGERSGKMVQQVKGLAIKPDDLNFIPGTHMVEAEQ